MSVRPSPLKSPANHLTALPMIQPPSRTLQSDGVANADPVESETEVELRPRSFQSRATSVRPSPLKSPATKAEESDQFPASIDQ